LCAKYWEIIADNLSKAGWRYGCVSSTDDFGRQFWVVAAEREDSGRFIVCADEKLTAFLELAKTANRTNVARIKERSTISAFAKSRFGRIRRIARHNTR